VLGVVYVLVVHLAVGLSMDKNVRRDSPING